MSQVQRPHAKPSMDARSIYAVSLLWDSATSTIPSAASSTADAPKIARQKPPRPGGKLHLPRPQTRKAQK